MGERRKTDSRRTPRGVVAGSGANRAGANRAGTDARAVTLTALRRIDEGAYANLVVPAVLEQTHLDPRDRHFVTELAYGVTRMRRALDFVVDGYLHHMPAPEVRRVLRLGAYQLLEMRVPAHAAVDSSVSLAPKAAQGLVNAVLRRVSTQQTVPWPSDAVRLSYPDWIVERLTTDLGSGLALETLAHMNRAPEVETRADGYVQDKASQWVAAAVGAQAGERVADVCAAPGGKATALAATGAFVVAADSRPHRVHLIATNAERLPRADGSGHLVVVAADALRSPLREASFDRVLVDAPCSGLGVLHRRPDARWSRNTGDVDQLARLQRQLVIAALGLLRPGGLLVYSVCTLTSEETTGVDNWLAHHRPDLVALPPPDQPWQPIGRGARLLPQRAATDGMALFRYLVPDSAP